MISSAIPKYESSVDISSPNLLSLENKVDSCADLAKIYYENPEYHRLYYRVIDLTQYIANAQSNFSYVLDNRQTVITNINILKEIRNIEARTDLMSSLSTLNSINQQIAGLLYSTVENIFDLFCECLSYFTYQTTGKIINNNTIMSKFINIRHTKHRSFAPPTHITECFDTLIMEALATLVPESLINAEQERLFSIKYEGPFYCDIPEFLTAFAPIKTYFVLCLYLYKYFS